MNEATRSLPPNTDTTRTHLDGEPDRTLTRSSGDEPAPRAEFSKDWPQVPGYEITRHIASGGMGAVYEARQNRMNRLVALKVIHGGRTASPKELIRFLAEAEAVAAIDHPNVVKVFDTGDAGGVPYLAMELLPAGTLSEKLKASPISPNAAATLFAKLAKAVQAAHNLQIVHRDLKPGNVLFDAKGEPKLTDFGLAKKASGSDLTATQAIMGTPAYMAPEQAKGESKFVGPQADVWALGVMLYECLSGKKPFIGSGDYEIIRNVIEKEPSKLRSVSSQIPYDLELIVHKCLRKDVAERYASAAAFGEDLERWVAGKPISIKSASRTERIVKWTKRNKIAACIMVTSILVAAGFLGVSIWAMQQKRKAESALNQLSEAHASRMRSADIQKLFTASLLAESNSVQQAMLLVSDIKTPDILNGLPYALALRECNRSVNVNNTHALPISAVAWSMDGTMLATGSLDNTVELHHMKTRRVLHVLKGHTGGIESIGISSDGKRLVSGGRDGLCLIWDIERGECLHRISMKAGSVNCVKCIKNNLVVVATQSGSVQVFDCTTGFSSAPPLGLNKPIYRIAVCPYDNRVAAASLESNIVEVWDWKRGVFVSKYVTSAAGTVSGIDWSPCGKYIATSGFRDDTKLCLWDAETYHCMRTFSATEKISTAIAFSPDSAFIAAVGHDRLVRLFDVETGQISKTYAGHNDEIYALCWDSSGRKLATGSRDRQSRIWSDITPDYTCMPTGPEEPRTKLPHASKVMKYTFYGSGSVQTSNVLSVSSPSSGIVQLKGHADNILCAAWSEDETRVATASKDGDVRIWTLPGGECTHILRGHNGPAYRVLWAEKDSMLITSGEDATIRFWDTSDGSIIANGGGHHKGIRELSMSPSCDMFISCGNDKSIILWDVKTMQPLCRIGDFPGPVEDTVWFSGNDIRCSCSGACSEHEMHGNVLSFTPYTRRLSTAHSDEVSDPQYYRLRYYAVKSKKNVYASLFHLRRLVHCDPKNTDAAAELKIMENNVGNSKTPP